MPVTLHRLIDDERLLLGIVEIADGTVRPASDDLIAHASAMAKLIADPNWELPDDQRKAVRGLLKSSGYSASGRSRPAHEFLINDIKERGGFNHINNVVDVNNLLSLECLLPISIFDTGKMRTDQLTVRIGEPDESYVFNPGGQWIDVKRCFVCCDGAPPGIPIGSPIKDSLATKVYDGATGYLGVIYGVREEADEAVMARHVERFARLLVDETGGEIVQATVV
jgi:DNA/RNA-binding domain of Phe-tRNA-synthetase-like protein